MSVISYSVFPWQAFPSWCNVFLIKARAYTSGTP
jgi:hypothetical protein